MRQLRKRKSKKGAVSPEKQPARQASGRNEAAPSDLAKSTRRRALRENVKASERSRARSKSRPKKAKKTRKKAVSTPETKRSVKSKQTTMSDKLTNSEKSKLAKLKAYFDQVDSFRLRVRTTGKER